MSTRASTSKFIGHNLRSSVRALVVLAFFFGFSSPILAKSTVYKQGLQHYAKGEFDKAVQELQKALNKKPSRAEKTKIYKYIGMSLYTLGRKTESEKNFEQCLANEKSCSISKDEALDESVLPFFQSIKSRTLAKESAPKAKTRIMVKTPIKDAEVLLDGILLGPANTSLDAKSGTLEITVQAPGYRARRVKIAVTKLVENVYEITLDKIPAKPEVKSVAKVDPKEKSRQARLLAQENAREEKVAKKKAKELDRARKLEARKAKNSKKDKTPPVLPDEEEALADLENNFKDSGELKDKEHKSGKKDKLAHSRDEDLEARPRERKDGLELPEERGPSIANEKPSEGAASGPASPAPIELGKEPISPVHFLPFGAGQFYNRDYLLGTLFFGAQAYSIGLIAQAQQDIEQAKSNEQAALRRAQSDPTVTQDDLDAFTLAKNNFVADKEDRINIAAGVLAGTYVFGVIHALIMRPLAVSNSASTNLMEPVPQSDLHWQLSPTKEQGLQLTMRLDL